MDSESRRDSAEPKELGQPLLKPEGVELLIWVVYGDEGT